MTVQEVDKLNTEYPKLELLEISPDGKPHDHLLDPKIAKYVNILRKHGIETIESCDGGEGHAYLEPTIRFGGQRGEGFRALSIALGYRFPVTDLRRNWSINDGEPVGPDWEMVLYLP